MAIFALQALENLNASHNGVLAREGFSFELSRAMLQVDYISWWPFELFTCEADGLKNEWEFLLGKALCMKNLGNGLPTQRRNYIGVCFVKWVKYAVTLNQDLAYIFIW